MRILIAEQDDKRRAQAADRLKGMPGITLTAVCEDLSKAFDTVEHRPPHLVLYAPALTRLPEFEAMETLCRHLSVRWMTFDFGRDGTAATANHVDLLSSDDLIFGALDATMRGKAKPVPASPVGLFRTTSPMQSDRVVLIGSSTGGVDALLQVLGTFPADCPPTLVVQHTGASFSAGLARLLDQRVEPKVVEAQDGDAPTQGTVMIAPGADAHLVLDAKGGMRCRLEASEKMSGHRPSVDALFKSAAWMARRVIAVILTGMGRDGAEGMRDLKDAGAETIGQDKATSLVYGMPGAAAEIGAVGRALPLAAIGPAILKASQARRV